jgi:hypothetical protein
MTDSITALYGYASQGVRGKTVVIANKAEGGVLSNVMQSTVSHHYVSLRHNMSLLHPYKPLRVKENQS